MLALCLDPAQGFLLSKVLINSARAGGGILRSREYLACMVQSAKHDVYGVRAVHRTTRSSLCMKTTSELDEALEAAYMEIKPFDLGGKRSLSIAAKGSSDTASKDNVVIRCLRPEELRLEDGPARIVEVSTLCTKAMFGSIAGSTWVLRNFLAKYGPESGRQSVMIVGVNEEDEIVACVGMEMMLLTENGMPWWADPSSSQKKRPFVSDLVVAKPYRRLGLGKRLLMACETVVKNIWEKQLQETSMSARLSVETDRIYLKVDYENFAAKQLYSSHGFKELVRVPEDFSVPLSDSMIEQWPVLHSYFGKFLR